MAILKAARPCSAVLVAGFCGVARAEPDCLAAVENLPPGYTHTQVVLVSFDPDPPPTITITHPLKEEDVKEGWTVEEARACGVYPVGTVSPPPNFPRVWKRNWNWCIHLDAGVAWKPKFELAASLAELVGASLGIQSEFALEQGGEYCETTEFTLQYAPPQSQCWNHYARVVWRLAEVRGKVEEADSIFVWRTISDTPPGDLVVKCGIQESDGVAQAKRDNIVQHSPQTPTCPLVPGVPLQWPDPWDGRRSEPCMGAGVPGCHETPPVLCGQTGGS